MVATQNISDPKHRKINRRIAYHKRKALHFLYLLVMKGEEPELQERLGYHHTKIRELKLERQALFLGFVK